MKRLFVAAAMLASLSLQVASAFDANTLAFYTFNDRPAGTEADGVTITNSVDRAMYVGTAEKATYGTFTFSDDRPARYIFAKCDWNAELIAENPNSLRMHSSGNSNLDNCGGTVSFEKLAEAIGESPTFTVEFFYKVMPNVTYWASYTSRLKIPVSNATDEISIDLMLTEQWRWRYKLSSVSTYTILQYSSSAYSLQDGLWHHIALVYKSDGKLYAYGDRDFSASVAMSFSAAKDAALELGCKAIRGYVTCLRVTGKALSTDDFMFASDRRDCIPREVFHWSLDGTAGETATTLSNRAESAAAFVTNTYQKTSRNGIGTIEPASDDSRTGTYVETAPMGVRYTLLNPRDGSASVTNGGGVAVSASADSDIAFGPQLRCPVGTFYRVRGDFTFEAFMKFDYEKWKARADDTRVKDVTIMGMWGGNNRQTGALRFGMKPSTNNAAGTYSLLAARANHTYATITGNDPDRTTYYAGLCSDGKWHHVCMKYDSANMLLTAYLDYTTKVSTLQMDQSLMTVDMKEAYYMVNGGLNFAAGDFEIDEVRLSRKLLSAEEMLHFEKQPKGMVLIFR